MENRAFFGGVPTKLDVKKLRDRYPDETLIPGKWKVSVEEVAGLLGLDPKSGRFQTVTVKWRRDVERATGKIIGRANKMFYVLSEPEKVGQAESETKKARRRSRRAIEICAITDRKKLNEAEKRRLDHQAIIASNILGSGQVLSKTKMPELEAIGGKETTK